MLLVELLQNCVKALLSYELFDIRVKKRQKLFPNLCFTLVLLSRVEQGRRKLFYGAGTEQNFFPTLLVDIKKF